MKDTVYVIDTNVILRYLLADHKEFYYQARAVMEEVRIGDRKVLILDSVIAECVYVLIKIYNVPRKEIAEKLKGILAYKGVAGREKERLREALDIFAGSNVDIVDAFVFVFATAEKNRRLLSFDKDLKKLARDSNRGEGEKRSK